MSTLVKRILLGIGAVVLLFAGYVGFTLSTTKNHSPEETLLHKDSGLEISVFYNRPYKKDRVIFGELVPYGEVWRTGANEATTFTTNEDLSINGETLPAGKYTHWTIPFENGWTVIFNNKMYDWGIQWGGKASREEAADILSTDAGVQRLNGSVEQFTIDIEDGEGLMLTLTWDDVRVEVPMNRLNTPQVEMEADEGTGG